MASQKFQLNDLIKKGFRLNESTGNWERHFGDENKVSAVDNTKINLPHPSMLAELVNHNRPAYYAYPIDSIYKDWGWCRIFLSGLTKGMNGSKGVMQMHWAKAAKEKKMWVSRIENLKPPCLTGQVKITFTKHCSRLMDWDNFYSSFKFIGDALVKAKVIEDDSPLIIVELIGKQKKVQQKMQQMEIFIEQIQVLL
jgi:Holliday junction resolvase RusA-like endonuclease